MGETLYTIGTDQQQAWMKKNCFPPRGYGYSEPGTYSLDATEVAAYNVAKSFYLKTILYIIRLKMHFCSFF